MLQTVFSGIQPTGALHIGNYLGAVKNWKNLIIQEHSSFFFSIVDLHAITVFQNPEALRANILSTFALYLACGIEGPNITVFQQSAVKEHAELAWILSCNTPIGWLDRMTQYKDKTAKNKERACLGLYSYPVLMAADILLYKTNIVPVGDDQKQHVELTRDIAIRFNQTYGDVLVIPEVKIQKETKRIMSLRDGTKKMSKSDESDFSRINMLDNPDTVMQKIKKAKTGDLSSPEIKNLLGIYYAFIGQDYDPGALEKNTSAFKNDVADAIIAELQPIQKKYDILMEDKHSLQKKLNGYNQKAELAAKTNMTEIRRLIGL